MPKHAGEDEIKTEQEEPGADSDELSEPEVLPNTPPSFNGFLSKFTFPSPPEVIKQPGDNTARTTRSTTQVASVTTKRQLSPSSPSSPPSSSRKAKKKARGGRGNRGYAAPSKYAHLQPVPDAIAPDLICIFIGINPGIATATAGHCYASPTNWFWRLMHTSGLTPDKRLPPQMDQQLPRMYSLGQTNIVGRATKDAAELSKEEMVAGVSVLEEKMRANRPESVCFVGKIVWEAVWKALFGRPIKKDEFMWGWQEIMFAKEEGEGGWEGCRAFVVPSTSGLVAAYSPQFKQELWTVLGDWVQMRRKERGEIAPRVVDNGEG